MPPIKRNAKQVPAAITGTTDDILDFKMHANKKVVKEISSEINDQFNNQEPTTALLEKHSTRPILSRTAKSKIKNYNNDNENEENKNKEKKINKNAKQHTKNEIKKKPKKANVSNDQSEDQEVSVKRKGKQVEMYPEEFQEKLNDITSTETSTNYSIKEKDNNIEEGLISKKSNKRLVTAISSEKSNGVSKKKISNKEKNILSEDEPPKKKQSKGIKKIEEPKQIDETLTDSKELDKKAFTNKTLKKKESTQIIAKEKKQKLSEKTVKEKLISESSNDATDVKIKEDVDNLQKVNQGIIEDEIDNEFDIDKDEFCLDKPNNFKITSWNIGGLRAWIKKVELDYFTKENPDIICFQEIKCTEEQVPDKARLTGYHPYWLGTSTGQAGVAIYSKRMPLNVEYGIGNSQMDTESRIITAEFNKFYLINVYVPNSGRKLITLPKRLEWNNLFEKYIEKLNKIKPVIICGDMNVSHLEIDLANPKANKRNAGFTQEERDGMSNMLSLGFVDTFRCFYPKLEKAYTYWTYMANARARNIGWRLDYFIVSERFLPKIVDNKIRANILGSDHCPITLLLNI